MQVELGMRGLLSIVLAWASIGAATASAQRPVIERIEPTAGPPGTQLQIVGRRIAADATILLGDAVAPVVRRLPHRWTVTVPANASSGALVIRTRTGDYAGPYFRVTAARPGPEVTRLEPSTAAPGAQVVLHGRNFSPRLSDNTVFLGNRPVVVRSATPTTLTVIVPEGAVRGPFLVRVLRAGQTQSPSLEVSAGTALTSFEPQMAPVGAEVVLRGSGFSARTRDNRVYLNNRRVRVASSTPTELRVQIPRRATAGPFLVDVRGGGRAQSSQTFAVQEAPRVRSFSPSGGPAGTRVTIQGEHFGSDPRVVQVRLGNVNVPVRRVLPDHIEVDVPNGAPSARFEVQVHALTVQSREGFEVLSPLSIADFQPRSGGPGTVVTIRGQGFSSRTSDHVVTIANQRAQVLNASPTQLRVRMPAASSAPIEVRVGSRTATTNAPFLTTNPPFIADFQPRSGPVGTAVTLRGTNFGNRPRLVRAEIGGRQMQVQSASDQQVVVVIPPGARSGRISVNVGMQGGAATNQDFRVEAQREVSSVSPSHGFAGTQVVIRGQNFPRGRVLVQFTGSAAVVANRVSPVELRVGVPEGAQSGPVSVMLPNGRAMPAGQFRVEATPEGTAISVIEPQCAYVGCRAVLRGHGFSARRNFNTVRFNGQPVRVEGATPTTLEIVLPGRPGTGRFELNVRRGGTAQSPPFMVMQRP